MPRPTSVTIDRFPLPESSGRISAEPMAPGAPAFERLAEVVDEMQAGSVLAPVTIVVDSTMTAITVRRALARRGAGVAGIQVRPLAAVAEEHTAGEAPPLTSAVRDELVRLALDEAEAGPLGDVRDAPATRRAVARTFRQLRSATALDGSLLDDLTGHSPLTDAVVAAYRRYAGRSSAYADDDSRLLALSDALREGAVDVARIGPVILYFPGRLTPAERTLVTTLAGRVRVHALVPATGDPTVDGVSRLRAEHDLAVDVDPALVGSRPLGPWTVIETPDAVEEARVAARRVLELLRTEPASDIAVLFAREEPHATVLRDTFRRAGIPIHGPGGVTLRQTASGTVLSELLRWHDEGAERTTFLDLLHSAPVTFGGQPAPARLWAALTAEANVTRHRRHWDRRLAALFRRYEVEARAGTERSQRFEDLAEETRRLRDHVLDLLDRLVDPQDRSWGGWSAWARGLVEHTLGADPVDDADARCRLVLSDLASLDGADPHDGGAVELDRASFVTALQARLDATAAPIGEPGRGVHLAPIGDAARLGHRHVVIVGANEGHLPATPAEDPLLPDRLIDSLGPQGVELRTSGERARDVELALAMVVSGAHDVTLTWSRADRRNQRSQAPSPWLLAHAGRWAGLDRPLRLDELNGTSDAWYQRIVSHAAGLTVAPPIDAVDRRLAVAALSTAAEVEGGDLAAHPALHVDDAVARGLGIERTRTSEDFSVYDAHVGSHPELDDLLDRPQSPTGLEAYGSCPRSFLFRRVLGVGSIEDPREPLTVSGRDRGSIIHEVLERYVEELGDREATLEERRHRIAEIADEVLAGADSRWPVGRAVLWQHEQQEIRAQLRMALAVEDALRTDTGVEVAEPEVSVGDGPDDPDATQVELPSGRALRFKGRIDRLDRDVDGTRTVIASDYKTGNTSGFRRIAEDPVSRGTKLQAAVYALMAEQRHPEAEVRAQYWAVNASAHPGNATAGGFLLSEQRAAIVASLDLIVDGIANGVFPATPGEWNDFRGTYDNCAYCPYDRICAAPGERERGWERDRQAPSTAPVRALHDSQYLPLLDDGGRS